MSATKSPLRADAKELTLAKRMESWWLNKNRGRVTIDYEFACLLVDASRLEASTTKRQADALRRLKAKVETLPVAQIGGSSFVRGFNVCKKTVLVLIVAEAAAQKGDGAD